jgi:ribosomal protein S18 acetylase RimI-like enzyme
MSSLLAKIQKHYRQRGIRGLAAGTAGFLARPFYERKAVAMLGKPARAESGSIPLPACLRDGLGRFYQGAAADVGLIDFIDARWKKCILGYLDAGAEIRLGRFGGRILSYQMSHDRLILDLPRGLRIPLRNRQVYWFDVQVAPEFRGQGIARHHMDYFEMEMLQRGVAEVISIVEVENQTSMRFHERNGFRLLRHGSYFRLAGLKSWKWGAASPAAVGHAQAVTP